jgi:hypothetical protein
MKCLRIKRMSKKKSRQKLSLSHKPKSSLSLGLGLSLVLSLGPKPFNIQQILFLIIFNDFYEFPETRFFNFQNFFFDGWGRFSSLIF